MGRLEGKAAIVCGVSGATGKAIALLFAREGARVLAVDASFEELAATRGLIEQEGGHCLTHQADVAREPAAQAAVAAALQAFSRIDTLVNNLERDAPGEAAAMSAEAWREVLEGNLTGAFLMCKHAAPPMARDGGGAIVNISSIASIRGGGPESVAYGASKAGLNQLARSLALQYAPSGVRCNAVLAGFIAASLDSGAPVPSAQVPMGHLGHASDIAEAALFLASDEAAFVTAAELVVDGGISATMVAPRAQ